VRDDCVDSMPGLRKLTMPAPVVGVLVAQDLVAFARDAFGDAVA